MMRAAGCRGQAGMTLIETIVTLMIVVTGVMAAVAVFNSSSSATVLAQRKSALIALAQEDLERIRPLNYDKVGLTTAPPAGAPALPAPAASEAVAVGGVIEPGPEPFSVHGMSGHLYRFVTWRRQSCPLVRTEIAQQVAAQTGIPLAQVQSALSVDFCSGTTQTKRITVVAVPEAKDGNPGGPAWLSTVAVDPAAGVSAAGLNVGLDIESPDASAQATTSVYAGVTQQTFYLYDTRCQFSTRQDVAGSHVAVDTSWSGGTCSGTRQADLMGPVGIPGTAADPLLDFSTDRPRTATGGLLLEKDSNTGTCGSAFTYSTGSEERKSSLHTWATKPAALTAETAAQAGRATLTFSTRRGGATPASGRMCVVLWRLSDRQVVGAADYEMPEWPAQPTQLSVSLDVAATTLAAGDRLMLTVRAHSASGDDLNIYYDHPAYQSALTIAMTTGKELL